MTEKLKKCGVQIPEILLPREGTDLTKWSVVACDQYTSQLEYWKAVADTVGDNPSTLRLIYPEVYLEEENGIARIEKINRTMEAYIKEEILQPQAPGFIYIDRKTSHAASRKGLILAVDLECYDYNKGSQTLIRATEGTVLDRLPPRIRIRADAPIELPHIMLLIDDPGKTVIEPLAEKTSQLAKIYDFDLMMNSGHIAGYKVDQADMLQSVADALSQLADPQVFRTKYGVGEDKQVLLFAAGDGNHSLASAKGHWENVKKTLSDKQKETHPARYALVEVVNVHDEGLEFEPIHRVVFNVDSQDLLSEMAEYFKDCGALYKLFFAKAAMEEYIRELKKNGGIHLLPFVSAQGYGVFAVQSPRCNLEVGTLQAFLDDYGKKQPAMKVDYIHGDEVVTALGSADRNMGFYLPAMDKNDLFKTVLLDGVLPRKTFSMGEADEKRFYLECRKIR